jgi:hypothetical protein
MTTQEIKLSILYFVRDTNDSDLLEKYYQTLVKLSGNKKKDVVSYSSIGQPLNIEEFQQLIDEAIQEVDLGHVTSHQDMKTRLENKYSIQL